MTEKFIVRMSNHASLFLRGFFLTIGAITAAKLCVVL